MAPEEKWCAVGVEATPGIEPGYTVLQSRRTAFMGVDESHPTLISFVEN
jgi:hypothetical protein